VNHVTFLKSYVTHAEMNDSTFINWFTGYFEYWL